MTAINRFQTLWTPNFITVFTGEVSEVYLQSGEYRLRFASPHPITLMLMLSSIYV
jgi:hypothetical protein